MNQNTNLSIYDNAKKAVSLLTEIDDVKDHLDKASAVAEYMKRAGDTELATKAAKYKMYCERQAGVLLKVMEKNKGAAQITRSSDTTTLKDVGISKDQSSKFQKLADIEEDKFDEIIESQIENDIMPNRSQTLKLSSNQKSHHVSQGTNDWYTPSRYIESARNVLGSIDVDPASSDLAQETVKAEVYYTIDNSGLNKDWMGNVWLNPPYSHPEVEHFTSKIITEYQTGRTDAIVLVNNSSDTKWFHELLNNCNSFCITKGRIGFIDISGEEKLQARQGQFFFYFGGDNMLFLEEFDQYGKVIAL